MIRIEFKTNTSISGGSKKKLLNHVFGRVTGGIFTKKLMHVFHNLIIREEIKQTVASNHHKLVIRVHLEHADRGLRAQVGWAAEFLDAKNAH